MSFTREVLISFQFEACHFWADAPDNVGFLRNYHRHMFHVTCSAPVTHNNRDIEFITLKQKVLVFCHEHYEQKYYIGQTSCEMIAEKLLEIFPELSSVSVFEDNENGAVVRRMP